MEVIDAEPPDLVVTDIQMPKLDGVGLLEQVRAKHSKLPVLAVTGYMEEEELKTHAFNGYLMKPVSVEDLREAVKNTLEAKRPSPARASKSAVTFDLHSLHVSSISATFVPALRMRPLPRSPRIRCPES